MSKVRRGWLSAASLTSVVMKILGFASTRWKRFWRSLSAIVLDWQKLVFVTVGKLAKTKCKKVFPTLIRRRQQTKGLWNKHITLLQPPTVFFRLDPCNEFVSLQSNEGWEVTDDVFSSLEPKAKRQLKIYKWIDFSDLKVYNGDDMFTSDLRWASAVFKRLDLLPSPPHFNELILVHGMDRRLIDCIHVFVRCFAEMASYLSEIERMLWTKLAVHS